MSQSLYIVTVLLVCSVSVCICVAHHGDAAHYEHNSESQEKFGSFFPLRVSMNKPKPKKVIAFNGERYGNWSDWSSCLPKTCVEIRFRECLDDSWESPVLNELHTKRCVSQYIVEKRSCADKTKCNSYVEEAALQNISKTCGERPATVKPKIIGGSQVTPHSWPWVVRLSSISGKQKPISFCGATLITPQWLVTAAHCLVVKLPTGRVIELSDYIQNAIYAHLGDHHESTQEKAQQDYLVKRAIIHPKYRRELMTDGHDIALLHLSTPVNISSDVNFACLPSEETVFKPGTICYAVGWGKQKESRKPTLDDLESLFSFIHMRPPFFGPYFPFRERNWQRHSRRPFRKPTLKPVKKIGSAEPYEVQLPIISKKECQKYYQNIDEDVHLCAGQKGKDTCTGDSGGGLYCQAPGSDQWTIAGVTSFGLMVGCGHQPGVYTSIKGHLDWIQKTITTPIY